MFGHGGAGAILSAGLFRLASYAEAENRVWNQRCAARSRNTPLPCAGGQAAADAARARRGYTSGDSLFTEIVFEKMRILPTDPGEAQSCLYRHPPHGLLGS